MQLPKPALYRAAMADPQLVEQLTGLKIHPAFYDIEPQGRELLVAIEEVPEEFRGIHLTKQGTEQMGIGWVIGAGPFAGGGHLFTPAPLGMVGYPRNPNDFFPHKLLYAHVIIGKHVGMPVRVSLSREYPTEVILMDEKGVKGVDYNPRTMKVRCAEGE